MGEEVGRHDMMARSFRKTPISGNTTSPSEKQDKRLANRRWRRRARLALAAGREPPLQREASDVWDFDKDGKRWFGHHPPKVLVRILRK